MDLTDQNVSSTNIHFEIDASTTGPIPFLASTPDIPDSPLHEVFLSSPPTTSKVPFDVHTISFIKNLIKEEMKNRTQHDLTAKAINYNEEILLLQAEIQQKNDIIAKLTKECKCKSNLTETTMQQKQLNVDETRAIIPTKISIDNQLRNVRDIYNIKWMQAVQQSLTETADNENSINVINNDEKVKSDVVSSDNENSPITKEDSTNTSGNDLKQPYKENTTVIIGDSMLYSIDETRMDKNNQVKVFCHRGADVNDIRDHIKPILRRKPKNIILHIGTNDCVNQSANQIFGNLQSLSTEITKSNPQCNVFISTIIKRKDKENANLIASQVNKKIKFAGLKYIDNGNISYEHLGRRGLHLNSNGVGKFAINLIRCLKTIKTLAKHNDNH